MTNCKGKSRTDCLASGDCTWVNARQKTPYCRKRPTRAAPAQGQTTVRFEEMTLKELKAHPLYKEIRGRSKMKKQELIQALKREVRSRRPRVIPPSQRWENKCKVLEEKCSMSTTLLGESWCDVPERDVIYTNNYQMCFEYTELLRIIHEGFVALDTSYEIPQLRMKLPRDPLRQFIPKNVIKKILLKPDSFDQHQSYFVENHELFYFLIHLDDFYRTFDKPQYTSPDVNPVQLSKDLEKWFLKYKRPAGGLRLRRINGGEAVEWVFRRPNLRTYTLTPQGKLSIYL